MPPLPLDDRQFIVALDTVAVWMRCVVLDTRAHDGAVFITYENWERTYDEWIARDSGRLQPWVEPRARAIAESRQEFVPDEAMLKWWKRKL